MVSLSLKILSFLEPVASDLFEIGYIICSVAIIIIVGWLMFSGGQAIYRHIKKIDSLSPKTKAIKDLSDEIGKLIQANKRQHIEEI